MSFDEAKTYISAYKARYNNVPYTETMAHSLMSNYYDALALYHNDSFGTKIQNPIKDFKSCYAIITEVKKYGSWSGLFKEYSFFDDNTRDNVIIIATFIRIMNLVINVDKGGYPVKDPIWDYIISETNEIAKDLNHMSPWTNAHLYRKLIIDVMGVFERYDRNLCSEDIREAL